MEYNWYEWKADVIQEPIALMNKLKSFNIKNKKIKSIRILGLAYDLLDDLEEVIYKQTNSQEESDLKNFKDEYEFNRIVEVDEPIIIEFEDGNRVEILFSDGGTVKIGLNSLPEDITWGTNEANVDGNVIFSNCLGKMVTGFSVEIEDEIELDWEFTGAHGLDLDENQELYIGRFQILLTDGLALNFQSWIDFGHVWVQEWRYHRSKIKWEELKKGISKKAIQEHEEMYGE